MNTDWDLLYENLLLTYHDRPLDLPESYLKDLKQKGDHRILPILKTLAYYSAENSYWDDNGSGGLPHLYGPFLEAGEAYEAILLRFFRDRLQQLTHGRVIIPEVLAFNKVYCLADDEDLNCIKFIIKSLPHSYMYYFKPHEEHRAHIRDSYHGRITETGEETTLENYQGRWSLPFYPDDSERTLREREAIRQHNQTVTKILQTKGFEA